MLLNEKQANEIRKALQEKMYGYNWERFNYCQAWQCERFIAINTLFEYGFHSLEYGMLVKPIRSYDTIVAFVLLFVEDGERRYEYYEIGKYSRTTSKQVTQIYNKFYSDKATRIYIDRM